MNGNTFYIEYLVTGAITLVFSLWAFGLEGMAPQSGDSTALWTLAAIPVAYILGIVIDSIGAIPEFYLRRKFRDEDQTEDNHSRTVTIFAWDNNVGFQIQRRRSRDRIVRGAWINLALLALFLGLTYDRAAHWTQKPWLPLALAIFLVCVWIFFFNRTRKLKSSAYKAALEAARHNEA